MYEDQPPALGVQESTLVHNKYTVEMIFGADNSCQQRALAPGFALHIVGRLAA